MSLLKSTLRSQNQHLVDATNRISELEQENAALREDKERLDWINANRPLLDRWRDQFFVAAGFTREGHKDIRAAIDAARARKKA